MLHRRSFLQSSALLPLVPAFVTRMAEAAPRDKDARVLVVVELRGGNDGLNTLVPLKNDVYGKLRPRLQIAAKDTVKLNDEFGLHSSFRQADKLIQDGHFQASPGVGYPKMNRSHFTAGAIWYTARTDPEEHRNYGWLGRTLDAAGGDSCTITSDVPPPLRGRRSAAVALTRLEDLVLADADTAKAAGSAAKNDLLAFVRRHAVEGAAAAEKLASLRRATDGASYPSTSFAGQLKLIARLLKADLGTRVFYARQDGYDTHAFQAFAHANLLSTFAAAVNAFFADLRSAKLADRVALFAFSEFGRTIEENRSGGTDHGTAGVTFLVGPKVKPGVVGTQPSLTDLVDGEPRASTDFRRIYATLIRDWLGVRADVLGGAFEPLSLFRV
jgi:uncharacterized protein (DUF1501 family)